MSASKDIRKVIIRILPPEIDEEDLVSTFPKNVRFRKCETQDGRSVRWIRFHGGKRFKGESKPSINARCYTSFDSSDLADRFIQQYHGHAFVDEKGEAFRAVCCYAPFQKIAKSAPKDKLVGTLESDPTYQRWLDKGDDAELSEKETEVVPDSETPLLQHVRSTIQKRRREQKRKEKGWWADGRKRCYHCGTKRRLEEDDDGRVWCRRCWESWNDDDVEENDVDDYSRSGPSREKDDDYTRASTRRERRSRDRHDHKEDEDDYRDDYVEEVDDKVAKEINCPGRHGLHKFIVDNPDWWCSVCRTQVDEGKKMFGCRICDYDCCGKCFDKGSGSPRRRERRRRERREREKKEKKRRKERRREKSRERTSAQRWEPKKGNGDTRVGELKDIFEEWDDEAEDGGTKDRGQDRDRDRERARKRIKKKRKREEAAAAYSFYSNEQCNSCGSRRRLAEESSKGAVYCEKCWGKWGKEKWVKK